MGPAPHPHPAPSRASIKACSLPILFTGNISHNPDASQVFCDLFVVCTRYISHHLALAGTQCEAKCPKPRGAGGVAQAAAQLQRPASLLRADGQPAAPPRRSRDTSFATLRWQKEKQRFERCVVLPGDGKDRGERRKAESIRGSAGAHKEKSPRERHQRMPRLTMQSSQKTPGARSTPSPAGTSCVPVPLPGLQNSFVQLGADTEVEKHCAAFTVTHDQSF